jgi:S-formylglutathione hydrolase FrmB
MAWLQVNFFSTSLMHGVPLNVLLPAEYLPPAQPGEEAPALPRFKTLYLLHGFMGGYNDWLHGTQINEMAQQFGIAVVMPSGDNSYYVDQPKSGLRYGEFVGKELVEFTRRMFPLLSDKREDTIIGGLSMGGYGAMRAALRYPETFGHCIALSSAVPSETAKGVTDEPNYIGVTRSFYETLFGDPDHIEGTDNDCAELARRILAENKPVPDLYFACGYNDALGVYNRVLHEKFENMGFKHVYEEGPGTHEWAFWNLFLRRGLSHALGARDFNFQNPFWVDNYDPKYDVIGSAGKEAN